MALHCVQRPAGTPADRLTAIAASLERTMKTLTGQPAVPFQLLDSEGHSHRLEDYRGSWLLMVFHRHLG